MTHRSINRTLVQGNGFIWVKNYKQLIRCTFCLKEVHEVVEFKYANCRRAYLCFDCSQKYLLSALNNLKLIKKKGVSNFFRTKNLLDNI